MALVTMSIGTKSIEPRDAALLRELAQFCTGIMWFSMPSLKMRPSAVLLLVVGTDHLGRTRQVRDARR